MVNRLNILYFLLSKGLKLSSIVRAVNDRHTLDSVQWKFRSFNVELDVNVSPKASNMFFKFIVSS